MILVWTLLLKKEDLNKKGKKPIINCLITGRFLFAWHLLANIGVIDTTPP